VHRDRRHHECDRGDVDRGRHLPEHQDSDHRRRGREQRHHPISAVLRIRPSPGQLQRISEVARETQEVAECHRITGDDCYLVRLHLRSIDEILDRFTPHGLTTTSIVHSTPVPRRSPPLLQP